MFIAHRPNALSPQVPRLAAHFASAKRFQFNGFDALQDGVRSMTYVEPQAAEFLFDLQDFERLPGFGHERLQVFAQPPHDVDQPSRWANPSAMRVFSRSPLTLNHDGQRSTSFCSVLYARYSFCKSSTIRARMTCRDSKANSGSPFRHPVSNIEIAPCVPVV